MTTNPNTFLIGAPKTGTTALARYMSDHQSIFFTNPKEPFYWCQDFPELRRKHLMESLDQYMSLFQAVPSDCTVVAEGSTNYLMSKVAVKNILEFNPSSRFIVMVRNPVDLVYAFHSTLLFTFNEDERNFEKAWRLQSTRNKGNRIPKLCIAPKWLQYGDVGSIGQQVQSFCKLVPKSQRIVIVYDDFATETAREYDHVLSFLGVNHDGRKAFPRMHSSKRHRFGTVYRFWNRPPTFIAPTVKRLRTYLRTKKRGIVPLLKSQFSKPHTRTPLDSIFRTELEEFFAEDVGLLSDLLNRDLSGWLGSSD